MISSDLFHLYHLLRKMDMIYPISKVYFIHLLFFSCISNPVFTLFSVAVTISCANRKMKEQTAPEKAIFPFNHIKFCSVYYKALLLGAYKFRTFW